FFFSSRSRHTRSYGDWSSDVCSSVLGPFLGTPPCLPSMSSRFPLASFLKSTSACTWLMSPFASAWPCSLSRHHLVSTRSAPMLPDRKSVVEGKGGHVDEYRVCVQQQN